MKKQLPLLLFIFLFFALFVQTANAVTISLSQVPSSIGVDSFTFTASISGAATGTNYLRVDLYKDGTSNYFGETYNSSDWYGGSDYTQYLPVIVTSGKAWIGQIQARVGNPTVTQYDGTGVYKLRLRRYTGSGSYTSTEADTTSTIVAINFPTSTPTPQPTNTPAPTYSPTPTPKIPTATPTVKPTSSKLPTSTLTMDPSEREGGSNQSALGNQITPTDVPTLSSGPTTAVLGASTHPNITAIIFYSLGGVLFVICGILLYRQYHGSKSNEPTSD